MFPLFDLRERTRSWTEAANIQGLGMAERITGGKREKELALKVYVTRKEPEDALAEADRVPAWLELPDGGEAIETRVIEQGEVTLEAPGLDDL